MDTKTIVAKELMETIFRFNKIHWHRSPIAGLTPSELVVLYCLKYKVDDNQGIKVSEISDLLNVTSPNVTQLVNSLENKGLVARDVDTTDRRVVQIKLTGEGEKVIKVAIENIKTSFIGLVDYLGVEDSNKLAELLAKVYNYRIEKLK